MKIEQKYYPFFMRVILRIYFTIGILLIMIIPAIGFDVSKLWFMLFFGVLPSILISVTTSSLLSKFYLKSIEFDDESSLVTLIYFEYNKKQEIQIELDSLNIRVWQALIPMRKNYKIQFFNNRKLVFQQREFMEWDKATFDKIVAHFKELKLANINSAK